MKRVVTLLAIAAFGHDLEENRATIVLRDRTHLSVSLYINYTEALYRALLPNGEYGAFLLMYSSMKPKDLERELTRAQAKFEYSLQFSNHGGGLKFSRWTWPDAKQVQNMLQHQVMQAMVDGHTHEPAVEIRADAVAVREIESLTVHFPEEFQRVLVVSYKPNQVWVHPKSSAAEIRF